MLLNIHEESQTPSSEINWRILQILVIAIVIIGLIYLGYMLKIFLYNYQK